MTAGRNIIFDLISFELLYCDYLSKTSGMITKWPWNLITSDRKVSLCEPKKGLNQKKTNAKHIAAENMLRLMEAKKLLGKVSWVFI